MAIPETVADQLANKSAVPFTVNAIPEQQFNARLARSAQSLVEANWLNLILTTRQIN